MNFSLSQLWERAVNNKQKYINNCIFICTLLLVSSLFISSTLSSIFFILFLITCLAGFLVNKYQVNSQTLNCLIISQILFTIILYFVHGQYLDSSVFDLVKMILKRYLPFYFFGLAFQVQSDKQKQIILNVIIGTGAFIGLIIILQNFGLFLRGNIGPSGLHSQPFTTGELLLMGFFINLYKIFELKTLKEISNKEKIINYIGLALQFIGLILLSQRALWLGLMAGLFVYFVLNFKKLNLKLVLYTTISVLLLGIIAYKYSPKFQSKLSSFTHLKQDKVGFGCRMEVWKLNWQKFKENPIFGTAEPIIYQCNQDKLGHAHNIILQKLVTQGLIGGILFIIFYGLLIFQTFKYETKIALVAVLIALLIEGLFENWIEDSEVILFFYYLVNLCLINKKLKPNVIQLNSVDLS